MPTMLDQESQDLQACHLVGVPQFIEDDKLVAYSGVGISQVTGFPEWYNVDRY